MQKNINIKISPGLSTLLGVLFIALKLTGYISWSWVWVLSPFWIPLLIVLTFVAVAFAITFIAALLK